MEGALSSQRALAPAVIAAQATFEADPVDPSADSGFMGTIDEPPWRMIFVDTVPLEWPTPSDLLAIDSRA